MLHLLFELRTIYIAYRGRKEYNLFMLNEINISKKNLPIDSGFKLEELRNLNVIVGKNNSGKTRFFESVNELYKKDNNILVVYIRANEVNPEDDYYKSSTTTSSLVEILSGLFGEEVKLDESTGVRSNLNSFIQEASNKFQEMCNRNDCGLNINLEDQLNTKEIIKSMIKSVTTDLQDDGGKPIALGDMGQGYQRMFIASLLQVYADRTASTDQNTLILFEEPELFLHPELKRDINKSLKIISSRKNHQVIISTHDPYFLWSNMNDENTQSYSFEIDENGKTKVSTEKVGLGVEDEMLHICLFSRIIEKIKEKNLNHSLGSKNGDNMEDTSKLLKDFDKKHTFIEKKYKYNEKDYEVILPIYIRNKIHHPENSDNSDYTSKELENSIRDMNHLLALL